MYELYIQNSAGTWQLADLGSEKPAINIQRNDIGEMKDRQTDYSQAVKLPKSPNNCRLFSFINEFTVVSELRHRRMNCRLYCDGYTIVGYGAYLKFVSVTDTTFNVQIVGALGSFFTKLQALNDDEKQITLNDLNFTEVINRGYKGFLQSEPANYPNRQSFFAIADFFSDPGSHNGSFDKEAKAIKEWMQYPFVKFKSIIDYILAENGITKLESDITNDLEYTNSCIPFDSLKPSNYALSESSITATNCPVWSPWIRSYIAYSFYCGTSGLITTITGYFGAALDTPTCTFSVPSDGVFTFQFDVSASVALKDKQFILDGENTYIELLIYTDDTLAETLTAKEAQDFNISATKSYTLTNVETMKFTLKFVWRATNETSHVTTTGHCSITKFSIVNKSIKIATDSKAAVGIDMPIKGNLPDITQEDFFKSFLQLFGLTVDVDADSNTMRAYTLNQVIKKKANAPDWSSKYSKSTGTVKFTLGSYAQTNQIEYKENDNSIDSSSAYTEISEGLAEYMHNNEFVIYYTNTDGGDITQLNPSDAFERDQLEYYVLGIVLADDDLNIQSKGYLRVDDDTLEKTYTLFDPIFKAVENNTVAYGTVNRYRYAKLNRISTDQTFSTGDTPSLLLFRYVAPVTIQNESGSAMGTPNLSFASSVSPSIGESPQVSVEAQAMIDKYYAVLTNNVLNDVRVIEDAQFCLTPKDIAEYDPFTPVYVDTFGAYFYVNKIKNFVSGKLTKVDLVRI